MNSDKILVVTADDFGYDCDRNRGILECFQKGAITRTSVLVNGIACNDAFTLAMLHNIPIGLHVNLSEGVPVSNVQTVSSLLSADEVFHGKEGIRSALTKGALKMEEIEAEIYAQVDAFTKLSNGKMPEFADGHQHVHILPGICEMFAKVLFQCGIQFTRVPFDLDVLNCTWLTEDERNFYTNVVTCSEAVKEMFRSYNLRFTDGFVGLTTMGKHMTAKRLCTSINRFFQMEQGEIDNCHTSCELMVHPGYRCQAEGGCGSGPQDFACSIEREHEIDVLTSDELNEFYLMQNLKLLPGIN